MQVNPGEDFVENLAADIVKEHVYAVGHRSETLIANLSQLETGYSIEDLLSLMPGIEIEGRSGPALSFRHPLKNTQ